MLNWLFLSLFWESRICRPQFEGIYCVILDSCFSAFQIFWWETRGVVWGRRRRLAEWLLMCPTVPRDEHHCTHSHYLWQVFLTTCDKYLSLLVTSISHYLLQVFLTRFCRRASWQFGQIQFDVYVWCCLHLVSCLRHSTRPGDRRCITI